MDILYFRKNGTIKNILIDKNLKILIESDDKYYNIIFNNYKDITVRNNLSVEWQAEIGEIELFREAKWEKNKALASLRIFNIWDDDIIFHAYVGSYNIEEVQ